MRNESGIYPLEYKVLIKMMPKEDITKGGIYIPETSKEKEQVAREVGMFISAGGLAFTGEKGTPAWPKDNIPKPGAYVLFDRYAGSIQPGMDGEDYRICNDSELGAIVEEDYARRS